MTTETITDLLERRGEHDPLLVNRLVPLLYDELRTIAHRLLAAEVPGRQTLHTTALVHEAYLKLIGSHAVAGRGRAYFFAAVARAMRQVLVDAARRRDRLRRGGGEKPLPLSEAEAVEDSRAADVLSIDRAMGRLSALFPRQAQVIECRFFGGLSVEETAEALEISTRTVKRDWSLAQAWLYRELASAG